MQAQLQQGAGVVTFTATVGVGSRWPNGKPVRSELLPDGRSKHWLEDGRVLTGPAAATYRIEYQSTWFGAAEGDTYDVNVSLIGLSREPGFVEVWNFDIGEIRNYAFHKIVRMHDLSDGFTFTGAKVCSDLGGQMLEL